MVITDIQSSFRWRDEIASIWYLNEDLRGNYRGFSTIKSKCLQMLLTIWKEQFVFKIHPLNLKFWHFLNLQSTDFLTVATWAAGLILDCYDSIEQKDIKRIILWHWGIGEKIIGITQLNQNNISFMQKNTNYFKLNCFAIMLVFQRYQGLYKYLMEQRLNAIKIIFIYFLFINGLSKVRDC